MSRIALFPADSQAARLIPDGLFISTDELEAWLGDADLRIVDLRHSLTDNEEGRREYEQARIPRAVFLHWLDDLSDPDDEVAGQIAPPGRFQETMERVGIGDDELVVAYDDNRIFMASRLAWCLRCYGHENVRILDGGFPKWAAEGRPIETGPASDQRLSATFTPRPKLELRATKQDVEALLDREDTVLLDCRMDETWNAAGAHIPGARRLPAPALVGPSGTLLPSQAIVAMAAEAGASPETSLVLYCGGGVSACFVSAALETVGFRDLRVYDGSWSEWSTDPTLPREQHAEGPQ